MHTVTNSFSFLFLFFHIWLASESKADLKEKLAVLKAKSVPKEKSVIEVPPEPGALPSKKPEHEEPKVLNQKEPKPPVPKPSAERREAKETASSSKGRGGEQASSSKGHAWDQVSSHPDMKEMMQDQTLETKELGTFRVALKPQSKRSPIAVLLHKKADAKKFTQKAQIVVKEPGVLAVDAMCILKLIATELAEKSLDFDEIKGRRTDLLNCLEDSPETLMLSMQVRHPRSKPENAAFFSVYQRRMELDRQLAEEGPL